MALIKCSECGHEVSDKASVCPNCGNPIQIVGKKHSATYIKAALFVLLAVVVLGSISGAFSLWNNSNKQISEKVVADSISTFTTDGELSKEQMCEEQEMPEHQAEQIREEEKKLIYQDNDNDADHYSIKNDRCIYYTIDPHSKLSASRMIDYPMTFVIGNWDDYNSKGIAYQLQQFGVPQNESRESVREMGHYSFSYHDGRVIHWWEQKIFMYEGIYIRRMTSSYDYYSYTTYGEKIEIVHEAVNKFENELQKRGINFSDNRNRAIWKTPSRIAYYRDRIIVIEVSEYKGQQGAPDENITYGTIDIHILKKNVYDKRSEPNYVYE